MGGRLLGHMHFLLEGKKLNDEAALLGILGMATLV